MPILFYRARGPYGSFTNFSPDPVHIYGATWKTSEAAFQAAKFPHLPDLVKRIWEAATPRDAATLGRDRSFRLRPDWDLPLSKEDLEKLPQLDPDDGIWRPEPPEKALCRVKDRVMYEVCLAKFQQNQQARKALTYSSPEALVEDSAIDSYWGWGSTQVGQNKLGRILMLVRIRLMNHGQRP
jgi:N-glycosidase YbiA